MFGLSKQFWQGYISTVNVSQMEPGMAMNLLAPRPIHPFKPVALDRYGI